MLLDVITGQIDPIYAGFLSAATAALVAFSQFILNKKPKAEAKNNFETIISKVNSMEAELKTNGGSSLKDFVMKTHSEISDVKADIKNIVSQQRARLEMQFNASTECIFLANEDGNVTFSNKSLQLLFGLNKDEMYDLGGLKAIENQHEREAVLSSWQYSIEEQIPFSMEFGIVNQVSRTRKKVMCYAEPIRDDDGALMWFFGKVKISEP